MQIDSDDSCRFSMQPGLIVQVETARAVWLATIYVTIIVLCIIPTTTLHELLRHMTLKIGH